MKDAPRIVLGLFGFFVTSAMLQAEEKNGVSLLVTKKTLDRNDTRSSFYYGDRIDRTQGLKATIKNTTLKPQVAGEVKWTILVRPYNSTTVQGKTATEPLKALKSFETVEMMIGSAQISGWKDSSYNAKDKLDYQVIVSLGGAEKVRVQSTPGFDDLAKRATILTAPPATEKAPATETPAPK